MLPEELEGLYPEPVEIAYEYVPFATAKVVELPYVVCVILSNVAVHGTPLKPCSLNSTVYGGDAAIAGWEVARRANALTIIIIVMKRAKTAFRFTDRILFFLETNEVLRGGTGPVRDIVPSLSQNPMAVSFYL